MRWIVYSLPKNYYENDNLCAMMEKGEVWKFGKYQGYVESLDYQSAIKEAKNLIKEKVAIIPYKPQLGMGATYSIGSDRYPFTIRKISESGKTIWLSQDDMKLISNSLQQKYKYETLWNTGERNWVKATLRRDGHYRVAKTRSIVQIGLREVYMDPSF